MQRSTFSAENVGAAYSELGIAHRPSAQEEAKFDQSWRNACALFRKTKRLANGSDPPIGVDPTDANGAALDSARKAAMMKEVRAFSDQIRDIDRRICSLPADPAARDDQFSKLEEELPQMLLRLYLLAACVVIARGVKDHMQQVRAMGFPQVGAGPVTVFAPILTCVVLLFVFLLLGDIILVKMVGDLGGLLPPTIRQHLFDTFNTVLAYGVSAWAAVATYARHAPQYTNSSTWTRRFNLFLRVAGAGYLAGVAAVLVAILPALIGAARSGTLGNTADDQLMYLFVMGFPPAISGLVVILWTRRSTDEVSASNLALAGGMALLIAVSAIFSNLLLYGGIPPLAPCGIKFGQYLVTGICMIAMAQFLKDAQADARAGIAGTPLYGT
jgi:hypothetical protein